MKRFLQGGGGRSRLGKVFVTVLSLAAFQVLAVIGAGAALAVTGCTFNPATNTINITIDPGESAGVAVENAADDLDAESPPGAILFDNNGTGFEDGANSTQCGSASNTLTTSIVVLGSPSNDELFFIDNFDADEFNTAITWAVDLGSNTVGGTDVFEIIGSDNTDDEVVLTDSSFTLNGGGGPLLGAELDEIIGDDGDDVIDGSALVSTVLFAFGGDDNDWIAPGAQATLPFALGFGDILTGDADSDTLSYGTRTTSVVVDAAAGDAGHSANADCDVADPGDEDDIFATFETFETGSGNDCIVGLGGVEETYIPGDGDDDITGNDDFSQPGGFPNPFFCDTLDWSTSSAGMVIDPALGTATGQGTDTYTDVNCYVGSDLDDSLIWDGSTVGFSGGDGTDKVDASATTGGESIDLDVLDGLPFDGVGAPADDLENAIGGTGNDDLFGNDVRNRLDGGEGDDDLEGDDGNDFLIGGPGNDDYSGGGGADKVSFKNSPAGVEADMLAGFATGEGDDSLDADIEILVGSQFNDTFTGGGGVVATNFRFIGNNGKDILTGSGSNDTIKGGGGKDVLRGVNGDDTLTGGGGNDRIFGGTGTDIGNGGDGKDTCKGVEVRNSCGTPGHPKTPTVADYTRAGKLS